MSDLTDKLVVAIQKGQLDFGDVVNRLSDQERKDFNTSLQNFADNEYKLEDRNLGADKWPARAAMLGGAGLGAALAPAAVGGAALGPAIGTALGANAGSLGTAAKWGAMGYGISKLPPALRTPAELIMIMSGMGGKGGAASATAGQMAGDAAGTARAAEELAPFGPARPPEGQAWPPNVELRGPYNSGRASRKPGMFSNMADQGGENSIQEHEFSPSSDPENLFREPGGTGRNPFTLDEADKRRIMFGGAGEGEFSRVKASERGPIKKATLRKPKN